MLKLLQLCLPLLPSQKIDEMLDHRHKLPFQLKGEFFYYNRKISDVFCHLCFVHPIFPFWFLVTFGNKVMKIQKYYVIFVYILQGKMGKTEKNGKKITQLKWPKYQKPKDENMGWTKHLIVTKVIWLSRFVFVYLQFKLWLKINKKQSLVTKGRR